MRLQTLTSFECILIDHLSIDASAKIAAEFAQRDPRFRVVRCEGSFVDALNCGVSQSKAPFVARMDADDRSHPQRLALQVDLLNHRDIDIASCLVECFPRRDLPAGMQRYESWINTLIEERDIRAALFIESPIPHPTAMFRRQTFESVGGYRDDVGPEDYDLWLRMILSGSRVVKVPRALVEWRDTPTRLSRTDQRYAKQQFFAAKIRHFPRMVASGTPLQIWGSGPTARRWSRRLREAGYEIRRFVDAVDHKVGRTVHGHVVESPAALTRGDGMVLAAVGLLGARTIIEGELRRRGFLPLRDYLPVA